MMPIKNNREIHMKHEHYDMIVAKAENTELVQFIRIGGDWSEFTQSNFRFNRENDYFLCLPQHKEACLHWLNGGGVQDNFEGEWSDCPFLSQTINTDSENSLVFSVHHMFMNEEFHFRIAPKKEKRWVGVTSVGVVDKHFVSELDLVDYTQKEFVRSVARTLTCHEIEIEVTG